MLDISSLTYFEYSWCKTSACMQSKEFVERWAVCLSSFCQIFPAMSSPSSFLLSRVAVVPTHLTTYWVFEHFSTLNVQIRTCEQWSNRTDHLRHLLKHLHHQVYRGVNMRTLSFTVRLLLVLFAAVMPRVSLSAYSLLQTRGKFYCNRQTLHFSSN